MKLCVLIIVSGLMCLGACNVSEWISDFKNDYFATLACILLTLFAVTLGLACVGGVLYGLYLLAVAFMGV